MEMIWFILMFISSVHSIPPAFNPNQFPGKSVILHLFEWKFSDIALECERWLGQHGFGAVQVSPVNEHLVFPGRPWWERYQPISYTLNTRSGDRGDFLNMTRRCNANGVRVYVDVVLNHMAGENPPPVTGTADSYAYPDKYLYPAVPYTDKHFNKPCTIENWNDPHQMRNCQVSGLRDLNHTQEYVRGKLVNFLNELIDLGAAGFRIDSAKHIWPKDLEIIYGRLHNLNTEFNFPANSRPFMYHEVIDYGSAKGDLGRWDYTNLGMVTDFMIAGELGRAFRGYYKLKYLQNWGPQWNFLVSEFSIVFVDEFEFQRGYGYGGSDALTHKHPKWYKMSHAFMLAHPHGMPRLISSYDFKGSEQGPPTDMFGNIISPKIQNDGTCTNDWICEHRWKAIADMVKFRYVVDGSTINNWWDNGNNQIAFSRGEIGFIAWNGEKTDMNVYLQTCLPTGVYCDIISGAKVDGKCSGKTVKVNKDGTAKIVIPEDSDDGIVAIHFESAISGYSLRRDIKTFFAEFWKNNCYRTVKVYLL